jgi:hypothetical protein
MGLTPLRLSKIPSICESCFFFPKKGRWRNNSAPLVLFNLVFYLFSNSPLLAETLQKLSLEQLTREADIIVRGRIQKVSSEKSPDRSQIITLIEVRVTEQWKGPQASIVTLSQPGGSVGGTSQAVPGLPHFSPGEELILFLEKVSGNRFLTVGGKQGKFVVKIDPLSKDEFVEDVTGKSQPVRDFLANVKQNLK